MHSSSSSSFICSSFSFRPSRPTLAFTSQRGRLLERTIGTTITSRRAVMGPSSSAVPRASKSSLGTPLSQMLPECVYLDYNATTPIFPEVAEEMMPFLETHFGNPSSIHAYAKPCSEAIRLSRERVKLAIGAKSGQKEVLFTSCGTESDNRAIDVACDVFVNSSSNSCPHVITTEVEHPAVLVYLESEQKAKRLTYSLVPVDDEGVAKINEYKKQLEEFNERVCCVSIMQANNETGVIQPVRAFADLAKEMNPKIMVHTDAAQSFGKVRLNADDLNVDAITIVGHKIGAPKGIAALYMRESFLAERMKENGGADPYRSFLKGGGQEGGKRAGTENVLHIVGLGKACEIADEEFDAFVAHTKRMRDLLYDKLKASTKIGDRVYSNGPKDDAKRLPNTLSVAIKGVNAGALLVELKDQLAASAGAACHSNDDGGGAISSVLLAMRLEESLARGTLRLSVGRHTTEEEVSRAVEAIESAASRQIRS